VQYYCSLYTEQFNWQPKLDDLWVVGGDNWVTYGMRLG
jgi:hypothetical protein